jgi:hypothetical protein
LVAGAFALTALAQPLLPYPYVWMFFGWSVASLAAFFLTGRSRIRSLSVAAFGVFLVLGSFEALLWLDPALGRPAGGQFEGSYTDVSMRRRAHPVLGYAPIPRTQVTARKLDGGRVLYDVVYSVGANGLRTAPVAKQEPEGALLFFGGSFTYGEGVGDEETLPYQADVATDGRFEIYNFGFHGYGPHQMLAALESGLVEEIVQSSPVLAVYQLIPSHVRRSAGLVGWGKGGPRYGLDDGRPQLRGRIDRESVPGSSPFRWLRPQLQMSSLGQRLVEQRATRNADVELLVAIVARARDLFESRFPGARFHVIAWDHGDAGTRGLLDALSSRGLRLHRVADAVPDIAKRPRRYHIPLDTHPNARAHRALASYVVNALLPPP